MAKRKLNKIKTFFMSLICLIVGLAVGFFANIYITLPESYKIPEAVQGSTHFHTTGELNVETIKSEDLSIHFIELGNKYTGDCTFVKVGNTEMLIDAGSRATSIPFIQQYIEEYCTDDVLEYVVVTHAHQDHYAGFATGANTNSLFDLNTIETVIDFGEATNKTSGTMFNNYKRELAEEVEAGAKHFSALECVNETNGATRSFNLKDDGSIKFEILYHKYYEHTINKAESENDYSVCLQIVHGEKKFLFTGDLEAEGEESLIEENKAGGKNEGMLSKVALYKAGHHGSKTSSSDALLEVIQPDIVCVCCCAGSSEYTSKNENQFPTQAFINRVSKYTSAIYVTTLCTDYSSNKFESMNGNIVVCSSGTNNISVSCSNNTTKLKDTEWFKQNRTLPDGAAA